MSATPKKGTDRAVEKVAPEESLSLEAVLVARLYVYTLLHKVFGGFPNKALLALVSSPETADVLDEYSGESDTLAKLKDFASGICGRADTESFLAEIGDEYNRFFEGPASMPAPPWESAYLGSAPMLFQPSMLCVREAYREQGLRVKCFQRVPDDHISLMCSFMSIMSGRTLAAFRGRKLAEARSLLDVQRDFVASHLNNWLPSYAKDALHIDEARMYPQFAQGAAAFTRIDSVFIVEAIGWLDLVSDGEVLAERSGSERHFAHFEKRLSELAALELRGIEENELVFLD